MQDLKKRKLPDDGTAREREPDIKKMCEALDRIESQVQNLRDEINRLCDRDEHKERQLAEALTFSVDDEQQLAETQSLLVDDREQQLAEARSISVDDTCKGNGTDESASSCAYQMLVQSLVGMKFSLKNEMEGYSFSIYHEASGYSFSLTWMDQADGGEWAYKYSSLGTLDRIALEWMKEQDIRFSMPMCHVFFQQISSLIG